MGILQQMVTFNYVQMDALPDNFCHINKYYRDNTFIIPEEGQHLTI